MRRRWTSVALRVSLAVLTRTFFQPDEFFQALEVAHHAVFGYGHLTWEWLAQVPIRSPSFPMIYAPIYWLLKITRLDNTFLLVLLPKVLTGFLASITDVAVYDLANLVLGPRYADVAIFLSWTSFFHSLSLVRSLSNSVETSLTTLALCHWLKYSDSASQVLQDRDIALRSSELVTALLYAGLATMFRPTNAVVWIFMLGCLIWRIRSSYSLFARTMVVTVWFGNLFGGFLFCVDSMYYGKATISPLNFLITNLSSVSSFYGSNPWHYYFTQALPILCTTSLPFVLHGFYTSWRSPAHPHLRTLAMLVLWTTVVYSMTAHKEWRFIHPLLPILHVFAAKSLVDLYTQHVKDDNRPDQGRSLAIRQRHRILLLLSIPASLYVMLLHGRAQVSVVTHLRKRADVRSVGFLMTCHSTPWQSHLHRQDLEGHIWALGCEPPLRGEDITTYRDQTRVFFDAPAAYFRDRFPRRVNTTFPPAPRATTPPGQAPIVWQHTWPSHLVFFGALLNEDSVEVLLTEKGYRPTRRFRNGWEEDEKRRGDVRLWEWNEHEFQKRFVNA